MKAETYIMQYHDAKTEIGRLLDQLNQLEEERDSLQIILNGMPRGSEMAKRVENLAINITDTKREILDRYQSLQIIRRDVLVQLGKLDSEYEKDILYRRYITKQPYAVICEELCISFDWAQKLRSRGLENLQVILDGRDENE